eukprot:1797004-Amphidinium_carterae.1
MAKSGARGGDLHKAASAHRPRLLCVHDTNMHNADLDSRIHLGITLQLRSAPKLTKQVIEQHCPRSFAHIR